MDRGGREQKQRGGRAKSEPRGCYAVLMAMFLALCVWEYIVTILGVSNSDVCLVIAAVIVTPDVRTHNCFSPAFAYLARTHAVRGM